MSYKIPPIAAQFDSKESLFRQIADELKLKLIQSKRQKKSLSLAISGGSTPNPLFKLLGKGNLDIEWQSLELFWVDERLVPPDDPDSNYGWAKKLWLEHIPLPPENIHPVNGLNIPQKENERYTAEILKKVRLENKLPVFDLIWLGIGNDGHTASLFPANTPLYSNGITGVTEHPVTHQKRITLTEAVLNNASEVIFIVTGSEKEFLVRNILNGKEKSVPASKIQPAAGQLKWYLSF